MSYPFKLASEPTALVGGEGNVTVTVGIGLDNVLVGRDQESGGSAGRVEYSLVLPGGDDLDDEVDDVARGAELAGGSLAAEHREQVLEGVSQTLGVVVLELVDDLEECPQGLRVAVGKEGVFEDIAEERRDAGILRHLGDCLGVEVEHLVTTEAGTHKFSPAVAGVVAGKEITVAAELLRLGVHIIHKLVDQGDGDLFDLAFGVGDLADKDVAGGIDAAFGIGIEHSYTSISFSRRGK